MKLGLAFVIFYILIFAQGCASIKAEDSKMEGEQYTVANFTEVKIGMSYDEVIALISEPIKVEGFNFTAVTYNLIDGSHMKLLFQPNKTLMGMNIIDPSGRIFELKQDN